MTEATVFIESIVSLTFTVVVTTTSVCVQRLD